MKTVIVWVLIISFHGSSGSGSSVVIDNIASAQSCEQLRKTLRPGLYKSEGGQGVQTAICAPVTKVIP